MVNGLFDATSVVGSSVAAADLIAMLRSHYLPPNRPPGGIFAVEIEAPSGSRRADVLWAPMTTYGDAGLVGHEIKVSRSDVLAELADPTKSDPWARHCSRWWLTVSSPSLVDGLDIPDSWGIMAPPSGRRRRAMTVIRPAPRLNPPNDGPAWHRLAAWQYHRLTARQSDLERDLEFAKRERDLLRDEADRQEFRRFGREAPDAERIGKLLRAVEARRLEGKIYIGQADLTDDDIADALVDLGKIRSLTDRLGDDLRWRLTEAKGITGQIAELVKDLESLPKRARP